MKSIHFPAFGIDKPLSYGKVKDTLPFILYIKQRHQDLLSDAFGIAQ